ncbi:MAG: CvpA family protein [Pseudomonadales bacterium]|jgi:membrane protein required for colicin V production|nr:CvpA family protein [Pseudomonadales bacterium]MDP7358491.1 CvpA family protein [Pseudomonadales bacterium]MDP7595078.1 CvpA family protein [Pseudomonadales bacterium]HJN51280.1 CvpA family protein [Pseudomonadales bacterium]|tara:strand:- start:1504 stop:1995 length:492 start_codon:yes stop_codon:yes gene_type:complete
MNSVDLVIAGVVVLSAVISIKRGFVKEALSLVSWIVAFSVARIFGGQLAPLLSGYITSPSLRLGVAFALLFAATLVVGAMINHLVAEMVRLTGLSGIDRLFGMVFGLGRGLIITLVVVTIISITPLTGDDWWQESMLIPHFMLIEEWSKATFLDYSSEVMEQF